MNPESKKPAREFWIYKDEVREYIWTENTGNGNHIHVREVLPDQDDEVSGLREDIGFWKKEATLHSDAREQFKKEIQALTEENAKLKESVNKMQGVCIDHLRLKYIVNDLTALLRECEGALEIADKTYWYDPFETGACMHCDANLHPNAMGKHQQLNGDSCPAQQIHDMLTKLRASNLHDTMGDKKDET